VDKKYEYLYPLPESTDEILAWCSKQERAGKQLDYFELETFSLVRIKRDRDWFRETAYPKLKEFWERILDARVNPAKYTRVRKERTPSKRKQDECRIEFDPNEEVVSKQPALEELIRIASDFDMEAELPLPIKKVDVCLIDMEEDL
jgi:hypothetical protein